MGVIVFGLWSIIRTLLSFAFVDNYLEKVGINVQDPFVEKLTIAMLIFILAADIAIRLKVGLDAVNEGKGKTRGLFYVIAAAVLFVPAGVLSFVTYCRDIFSGTSSVSAVYDAVSGLIVETTSLITSIEMLYSAVRVKLLRKNAEVK